MNAATMPVEVARVDGPREWEIARRLVDEYATGLGIDLSFQQYQREIASLPEMYGGPRGCFALARASDETVGCGGFRALDEGTCEMKRLYVVPRAQGRGIGRAVAAFLIGEARRSGYQAMLLDTLPSMDAAHALYASLGFTPAAAYRDNPIRGATFWRLSL